MVRRDQPGLVVVRRGRDQIRIYAADGEDLGTRTFSEANWKPGDILALGDRVYHVHDVVSVDDGDIRGLLRLAGTNPEASL